MTVCTFPLLLSSDFTGSAHNSSKEENRVSGGQKRWYRKENPYFAVDSLRPHFPLIFTFLFCLSSICLSIILQIYPAYHIFPESMLNLCCFVVGVKFDITTLNCTYLRVRESNLVTRFDSKRKSYAESGEMR